MMMIIPEPDRRGLSQVETALGRVQECADALRRVAVGDPVETAAKPAADPRLGELLKLVENQRTDSEDRHTDRDVWRLGEWARRCRAGAAAVVLPLRNRALPSMKGHGHKLARASVTLSRVRDRYARTTRRPRGGNFQKLLHQFDRELQAHSNRLAAPQCLADQRGTEDAQKKPADLNELCAALWRRVLNTIGRDAIKDQTIDWPAYFQGLRDLVTTTITNTRLSADQRALLIRQLIERIDRLESFWPVAKRQMTDRAPAR
jgi:hypothetical protein